MFQIRWWGWMMGIYRWAGLGALSGVLLLAMPGSRATAPAEDLTADLTTLVAYVPVPGKAPVADQSVVAAEKALDKAVGRPEGLSPELRVQLDALVTARGDTLRVTKKTPVMDNDPLRWVLVNYRSSLVRSTPAEQVTAAPEAAEFPGSVPAGTATVTRTLTIAGDTDPAAWRSTGLYAAPGAQVVVHGPANLAGMGVEIRIGAQSDSLRPRHRYVRLPEISRTFPFEGGSIRVANAFGGLIYVMLPGGAKLGKFDVTIAGAVEAPWYVEGVTTPEEWKKQRDAPAPWGEFEAKNVIYTVPSSYLRTLDDPATVAQFWDGVVSEVAEFMGRPTGVLSFTSVGPSRPERYVPDEDISAGYMHAGYPIMTMMDTMDDEMNPDLFKGTVKSKRWGLMHELGHDYQTQSVGKDRYRDWTPSDCGEVTNNMAPLYVSEQLGMKWQVANPGLLKSQKTADDMLAAGQKPWTSPDLFVKLFFFVQLEDGLGWKPIHAVLTEEYNLPAADRPKTDEEKRDQWLIRLSKASGKNLGPYFERWGFETSEAARAQVAGFASWMPATP